MPKSKKSAWPAEQIEKIPVADLRDNPHNSRTHSAEQIGQIARSMAEWGWTMPILVDEGGTIIAGHARAAAARSLGFKEAPCMRAVGWSEAQKRAYVIADNKLTENGGWDMSLLGAELEALADMGFDTALTGFGADEIEDILGDGGAGGDADRQRANGALREAFLAPPFSVLDTKAGPWQDRKRLWAGLINDEGESREGKLCKNKNSIINTINRGVSILDPVLSEVLLTWFSLPGHKVLDPFAGDTVFGYVADYTGREFTGIELRAEQCALNAARVPGARYINDTSENVLKYAAPETIDFVFSCPPYADLEVYSDDPRDLSTLPHAEFFALFGDIMGKAAQTLREDRFCALVVSEVRGKDGPYIGLVPKTIEIMERAGLHFYNEIILLNMIGTLRLRAPQHFQKGRKVGRCHQNVLVFYKGDPKKAGRSFGPVAVAEAPAENEEGG
jgi:hypothetical protein